MTFPSGVLYPGSTTFPSSILPMADPGIGGMGVELSGLVLTRTDSNGVQWRSFSPIDGWDGSPASSVQLTQKLRAPGAWMSPRNMTQRVISLTGVINAPTVDALQTAIDQLNAACTVEDTVLTVQRGSAARSCIVCRQGEVMLGSADETDLVMPWSIQLVASDPRKFTTAVSGSTNLPSSTGGMVVPMVVPLVITSTVVPGTVALTNQGNASGPLNIRVTGPVAGPQITHVTTGKVLTFDPSLVLGVGEWLDIDMEAETVLANGQSSRNGYITSAGWSPFVPGVNLWQVNSSSYNPATVFTITGTPAWL